MIPEAIRAYVTFCRDDKFLFIVHTAMLSVCENEDGLATTLGHEKSFERLEKLSREEEFKRLSEQAGKGDVVVKIPWFLCTHPEVSSMKICCPNSEPVLML